MKSISFVLLLSLVLAGCYSSKNYNMYYLNLNRTIKERFKPTKSINTYDYTENNVNYFNQNGYVMIGYDALRHTYIGYQEAVNAGCWIGASVMLYKHEYIGTASGRAVVPFYNPGQVYTVNSRTSGTVNTYSTTTASAYGSGGYAYGSSQSRGYGTYNSNTTTTFSAPGSFSYYSMPYANDYYDQYAIYYVKKFYRIEREVALFKSTTYDSKILTKIMVNDWFEVIAFGEKYNKILYKGHIGYVSAAVLLK